MDVSREFGLTANVIEKDYVLGWILAGISNNLKLTSSWVFKGGTCLKKCYFETYRFSEDLDFTITDPNHINEEFLINAFHEISDWVYETSGIEIPKDTIRFEIYENPQGILSVEGRVNYRGPMRPGVSLPRIKLDLTKDEILVLDPVKREVHHPYSDRPEGGIIVQCYCYEELFAEKIRALGEREKPRDLYDVVNMYRYDGLRPDRALVTSTLEQKCNFKKIPIPNIESLDNKPERQELEAEWENMLAHQLPLLPPFTQFWQELPTVFDWLYRILEKAVIPSIPLMGWAIDETWSPPIMAQPWHLTAPLELIRFAATNRLCVILNYIDANGNRKNPIIEPYSLRKTREGNLLLYAVKHNTGEDRSYRIDRMQGAEVTKEPFTPRYIVELKATVPISASPIIRTSSNLSISKKQGLKSSVKKTRRASSDFAPTYVVECPFCGKRFKRKISTTRLNPHKDKTGYPCPGRTGNVVDIKY